MFCEIFEIFGSLILGCILMVFGLCLIRSSSHSGNPSCKNVCDDLKKIKNFLCSSFGFGSFIIFLGFAIFASWNIDDLIDDLIEDHSSLSVISFFSSIYDYLYEFIPWLFDALKYVSLNSFWSSLYHGCLTHLNMFH